MFKVLLIIDSVREVLFRQIPHQTLEFNNCEFYINEEIQNPDFVFFFDQCPKDYQLFVNPKNVCLVTGEPPSVKFYSRKYTSQFNWLLSCQKNVYKRHNGICSFPLLPWLVGIRQIGTCLGNYAQNGILDYNYFAHQNKIDNDRLDKIAVITSNKRITKGHRKRLDYIEKLSELLPGIIDKYGNGFKSIEDKYEVYKKYKYLLVIENCQYSNYWTEKLSDAFLSNCYPFYIGAPNILDYFSSNSLTSLDYDAPKSALAIKHVMENQYYKSHFEDILASKDMILDKYNMFVQIANFVNSKFDNGERTMIWFKKYAPDIKSKIYWRLYNLFKIEI